MESDRLFQPRSESELSAALSAEGRKVLIAGGTDLVMRFRKQDPGQIVLIDLSRASFLRRTARSEDGFWVGAGCTMTDLEGSPEVRDAAAVLSRAAARVGSAQIRNLATIGGNVAGAAQCADTLPALIALDADAELLSASRGVRRMKVAELVVGIGRTRLADDEAITGFRIPVERVGLPGGFGKVGARKAVTIAKINGAGVFRFENGVIREARFAFGSLGETAFLAEAVSRSVAGRGIRDLSDESLLEAFQRMVDEAIPTRASLPYKRSAVRAVAAEILDSIRSAGEGA